MQYAGLTPNQVMKNVVYRIKYLNAVLGYAALNVLTQASEKAKASPKRIAGGCRCIPSGPSNEMDIKQSNQSKKR